MQAVKLITPMIFFLMCVGLALFLVLFRYIFKKK
jgi:hypothetical protein